MYSTGRITWYVNSRAMLEPLFRYRGVDTTHAPRRQDFRVAPGRQSQGPTGERFAHFVHIEDEAERAGEPVVVAPVDFSTGSLEAVRVAVSVARYTHASLLLCHAVFPRVLPFGPDSPPWVIEALQSEAMQKMAAFRKVAEEAGVKVKCLVEAGTPVGVILKIASRYAANLIVLASREHNAWAQLLFGKTIAEQVAQEADCHVMLVRRDQA